MGYRSEVRSVIYGPDDKMAAFIAKHTLLDHPALKAFEPKQVEFIRTLYQMVVDPNNPEQPPTWERYDVPYTAISIYGDAWKWYDEYEDVQAWDALMADAMESGLSYEFIRIGEEADDIVDTNHIEDGGDCLLGVTRSSYSDIEERHG